jgi:opacity protein-like surface antigen
MEQYRVMQIIKFYSRISAAMLLLAGISAKAEEIPTYRTDVSPRTEYATGGTVAVFGGANLLQSGDLNVSTPLLPGASATLKTKNRLGGVAGIKAGYTWPGWGEGPGFDNAFGKSSSTPLDGHFKVLPAFEYEFFRTGFNYKAGENFSGTDVRFTADLTAYVLSVNPMVKFQMGFFRPYIGLGIGGAYLTASNAKASASGIGSTNLVGSDDDIVLALQGIVGTEIFVAKNWALSLEYKNLNLINPSSTKDNGTIPIHYKIDNLNQQILTGGLRVYF